MTNMRFHIWNGTLTLHGRVAHWETTQRDIQRDITDLIISDVPLGCPSRSSQRRRVKHRQNPGHRPPNHVPLADSTGRASSPPRATRPAPPRPPPPPAR